jgi:BirA family biotin operon repressor/biotin-[acetyl-CoA-carboxylase] ligase
MFDLQRFSDIAPEFSEQLYCHEQLGSTNDEACRLAAEGAPHGTVILAECQAKGRGRRGAIWLSEPGKGLTFSIVLRPRFGREHNGKIALAAGLGIATALRESFFMPAELKWPNDILIAGRKCCGILVEAQDDCVVLGVGLNVYSAPDGFAALAEFSEKIISREQLLALLLRDISNEVGRCGDQFEAQIRKIEQICYLTDKSVHFQSGGSAYQGEVEGLAADGSLIVRIGGSPVRFTQASDLRTMD